MWSPRPPGFPAPQTKQPGHSGGFRSGRSSIAGSLTSGGARGIGFSPMTPIRYALADTNHGPWWIAWTEDGVCAGAEADWGEERFVRWLAARHDGDVVPGDAAAVPDGVDWRFVPPGFRRDVLQ